MVRLAKLSVYPEYFRWTFLKPEFDKAAWVKTWIEKREMVYDTDDGGEEISYWVVIINGVAEFYKLQHIWGWTSSNRDRELENHFEFTEVTREDLDKKAKENLKFVV